MKSGLNQDRVSGTPAATGEEAAEALTQAVDALESAVSMYIEDRRDIPKPSPVKPRGKAVILPALTEAKLALDSTMRANRVGKAELARRLNCRLPQVDRLLDLLHPSRLDQLEAASVCSANAWPSKSGNGFVGGPQFPICTACDSGKLLDDPPAQILYSPPATSKLFLPSLKMERYSGSIVMLTVLLSPAARSTFCQPISLLGGSLVLAGSDAYTSAISFPARLPPFFTLNDTVTLWPAAVARSPEYAKVV